ncbi:thioredoxin-like protein [Tothia fuscella]|uniref:Thioredoxin-like protein n=1 Tax=Tothia fuscella TaxID=1048955 RepID=A0A9P4TZV5_9PEZI|nr:thioredoxin-like protein [Tothia fuscella]
MPPSITLYTNHGCPYAHRAHIALKESGLEFEEVIIDLDKPREPWYLEVNPRGLVPALKYSDDTLKDEIITESAVVAQFIADVKPTTLLPASNSSPTAALERARINYFVDTWNTKIGSFMFAMFRAGSDEEKEIKSKEWVAAVQKEIEPLLKNASPFFNGSKELTLAEVNIAPFLLRIYALSNGDILPQSVKAGLEKLPKFSKWANATMSSESVLTIWDEETVVSRTSARIQKMKAQANRTTNGHK